MQVSGALNPESGEGSKAFQECVLARHPRHGEFAIAFITGRTVLQVRGLRRMATGCRLQAACVIDSMLVCSTWLQDMCNLQPGGCGVSMSWFGLLGVVCLNEREVTWLFVSSFHSLQTHEGDMRLVSVYVPTNHVYVGECAVMSGSGVLICCALLMTA